MAQMQANVKRNLVKWRDRFYDWLECHPRTLAWIVFWLALNYVIDFLPRLF